MYPSTSRVVLVKKYEKILFRAVSKFQNEEKRQRQITWKTLNAEKIAGPLCLAARVRHPASLFVYTLHLQELQQLHATNTLKAWLRHQDLSGAGNPGAGMVDLRLFVTELFAFWAVVLGGK